MDTFSSVPPSSSSSPSSSLAQALPRQRPQQAVGCGEQVDGGRSVCDEGGLQPQSLEHFHLEDGKTDRELQTATSISKGVVEKTNPKNQPIRAFESSSHTRVCFPFISMWSGVRRIGLTQSSGLIKSRFFGHSLL